MSMRKATGLLTVLASLLALTACGFTYIPPEVQDGLNQLKARNLAARTLQAQVIRADTATSGRVQITGVVTNIAANDYQSNAGQQSVVLFQGGVEVARQDFEDLAVNESIVLTYDRDWNTTAAGLPDYPSPERAVGALKAMHGYAAWRNRPTRVVTRFRVNRRRVERIITRRLRSDRPLIGEVKGKSILQAYGFQIPDGHLAVSVEEAMEISERIGYPVAMKIVSSDIIHKTDLGGVRLNVANAEEVRDYFDLMMLRIGQRAPEARIEGIYVEKMLNPGLEVIIGMSRDPQFGPMLMFGLGGIFVEVLKDVTFHLAPITEAEALQMLKSTRSYEILQGKRGQKGVDLGAIANGLQRISQLTTDFPQIVELDINPFIVGEAGNDPWVADVRMTLRG
jgi:hypothetical protein